jgi:hypothetical protein
MARATSELDGNAVMREAFDPEGGIGIAMMGDAQALFAMHDLVEGRGARQALREITGIQEPLIPARNSLRQHAHLHPPAPTADQEIVRSCASIQQIGSREVSPSCVCDKSIPRRRISFQTPGPSKPIVTPA